MDPSLSFNIGVLNELTNAIYLHLLALEVNGLEKNEERERETTRGCRNNRQSRKKPVFLLLFSRSPHASANGRIALL